MITLKRIIATVGFLGYSPFAPGTVGSLAAALAFIFFPVYLFQHSFFFLIILSCTLPIAIWSAGYMEKLKQQIDPSEIVIDEVVGMIVTMAYLPLDMKNIIIGFFLFRILDIVKPFPARQAEKLPGGWGVVGDDVIAGIYANLILRLIDLWGFNI